MRTRLRSWMQLLLLVAVVAGLASDGSGLMAAAEASDRTGSWEMLIPVRYISGKTLDFEHGSSIDLHSDIGWGFGFGYNLSEKMNIDFEFAWMDANYAVTIASADNPPLVSVDATGYLEVTTTQINFNYYFMPKTITPYVSAGFGWLWYDTNIPTGPATGGCYWDPWYGQICGTYQDTATGSGFSYGFGAGVRIEPKQNFFLRLGVNDNWQDLGSYSNSPDFISYRLDMGWKF
jgi:opacity protein-like surface antigen